MELFSPADRAKIEALTEDPNARVSYALNLGALLWSDEIPTGIEATARENLLLLVTYRSIMYRPEYHEQIEDEHHRVGVTACRMTWEAAKASGLRWIGFSPSRTDPANLALLLELEAIDL